MAERDLGDGVVLRLLQQEDAQELFDLAQRNLERLLPWLPWAEDEDLLEGIAAFLARSELEHSEGKAARDAILVDGRIAGVIGLEFDVRHRKGAIGYWIDAAAEGRGIVTRACEAMIKHAFVDLGLARLEIKCAPGNRRSRAIPERLGFTHEATLRRQEYVAGRFLDHAVYALHAEDWSEI